MGAFATIRLAIATALGTALLLSFGAVSGQAAEATIEATGSNAGNFAWTPSSARVPTVSGTVEFKNQSPYLRAVEFEPVIVVTSFGPVEYFPNCSGVPSIGEPSWSGTCSFPVEGEYHFHDPAHPAATGVVTVLNIRAPDATTDPATAITEHNGTVNGTVNPRFLSTSFHFKWGPTTAYGQETKPESVGSGAVPVPASAELAGLTPGATYHYRLIAENSSGTTAGEDRTFTTRGPPLATTELATDVGGVQAALNGTVNPTGLSTTYHFNYGTTTAYGLRTLEEPAGSGFETLGKSVMVTGLELNTTYHFQLVAKNSEGVVKGADRSFTTLGPPQATTGLADTITPSSADLTGIANAQGQETTIYFNWGPTSAYGKKTPEEVLFGKGLGDVDVGAAITGLLPATTYHFQLIAQSRSGTAIGSDQTFVTNSGPPPPPPPVEEKRGPPDTLITSRPPPKTRDRTPTVKFEAVAGGASFECSVDGTLFKSCRSPFTAPSLKPGKHRIRVCAVVRGRFDPTPATVRFKVLGAKKEKR